MNKIWAFGCSQTYGHGLEDCYREENGFYHAGKEPSKFAYPQLIGDALDKEVINLARPGMSNKHILHKIKLNQSEMNKNDIVIIHWTYIERHGIFNEDSKNIVNIRTSGNDKISKQYYKHIYNDYDANSVCRWYMNYAHLTLKEQGIKSIHCPPLMLVQNNNISLINSESWHNHDFVKDPNFENDISFVSMMIQHDDLKLDKGIDDLHVGPKTHRAFADLIIKEFF